MSHKKPKIIKQNGAIQHADILLTKQIAYALTQKILAGENLYPKEWYHKIDTGEEEPLILSCNTIKNWINRANVIPETGQTFRELVEKARVEYRVKKREERAEAMLEDAEVKLHRAVKIRTKVPVRNMFGKVIMNDDGSVAMKEHPELLNVQVKAAMYLTERLDPNRYGRVDKSINKHLVFNLADLRKAKEAMKEESQP